MANGQEDNQALLAVRELTVAQQIMGKEFSKALDGTNTALDMLRFGIINLHTKIASNIDFIGKFTDATTKLSRIEQQSAGNFIKLTGFLEENSERLDSFSVSYNKSTQFMIDAWQEGVRSNNIAMDSLADDLLITGQDTRSLINAMQLLTTFIDEDSEAVSDLMRVTRDTSKKYGITSDKLLEGIVSLGTQLESFTIYGPQAVGNLAKLGVLLEGATVGKQEARKQIGVLLSMGDAMEITKQEMLGLKGLFTEVRDGSEIGDRHLQMIVDASEDIRQRLSDQPMQAQVLAETIGRPQIQSLLALGELLKKNNQTTDELKASADDQRATLAARQESVDRFYDQWAPEMLDLTKKFFHTALAIKAIQMGMALKGRLGAGLREHDPRQSPVLAQRSYPGLGTGRTSLTQAPAGTFPLAVPGRRGPLKMTPRRSQDLPPLHPRGIPQSMLPAPSPLPKTVGPGLGQPIGRVARGLGSMALNFAKVATPIGAIWGLLEFGIPFLSDIWNSTDKSAEEAEKARKLAEEEAARKKAAVIKRDTGLKLATSVITAATRGKTSQVFSEIQMKALLERIADATEALANKPPPKPQLAPVDPYHSWRER